MRLSFAYKLFIQKPCESVKYFTAMTHPNLDPLVVVKQGKLKGTVQQLFDGSKCYSFKGIPYAHVPDRFLAPAPLKPWQGVYDATKHGPKCPQYDLSSRQFFEGDENCLFLNVYTKSLESNAKIPVMVFIHGGAYMSGSGDVESGLGPDLLLQHDVILVTINYRLEAIGFLCLDTPEVPGNAGMKDQVQALRWVKENIKEFGGDPDNITLFGESAGAASVTFHMQSPMSQGLFHKAIAQSGVSIADWAQGKGGKQRALRAAKYLGKDSTDTKEVLDFLRSVPAAKLNRLTFRSMTQDEKYRGLPIHFAPVVENKFENVEPFITEEPKLALEARKLCNVPLMLGYNSVEGLLMLIDGLKKVNFINMHLEYLVPREIAEKTPEKSKEFGERIRKFYVGDREFTEDDAEQMADMLSDIHFIHSIQRFANFYSRINSAYLYKFDCDTELNLVKNLSGFGETKGACHADELFYLFYSPINSYHLEQNPELKDVTYRMTKLWTDFAKTGNPTPDNTLGVKWSPYTPSKRAYLNIGTEKLTEGQNLDRARVDFWNKIYEEAGLPCVFKSNL